MFLRRMMALLVPSLLCLICCLLFRWLDRLLAPSDYLSFGLKGLLLGISLALTLPAAGIRMGSNGLIRWLYGAAAIPLMLLVYTQLANKDVLHIKWLDSLLVVNGQIALVLGAVGGFLLLTAVLGTKRRKR